jgi:hypothetical protein
MGYISFPIGRDGVEAVMRRDESRVLDRSALQRAILVGTFLQALTVMVGHFGGLFAGYEIGFLFAGMMISATVGYLYAQDVSKGYGLGACGGAISGGVCALMGIAFSVVLGDMALIVLLQRTLISTLTGAVGGVFGQMAADWE